MGLRHPEIFGNVLAQSSALWLFWPKERALPNKEHLTEGSLRDILREEHLDLEALKSSRFYLEMNELDHPCIRAANLSFDSMMGTQGISWRLIPRNGVAHESAAWQKFLPGADLALKEMRAPLEASAAHPTPLSTRCIPPLE